MAKKRDRAQLSLHILKSILRWVVIPSTVYLGSLGLFEYPAIRHLANASFTDQGDGLQNLWNLWWVNLAVTHLHQLPWHTMYLEYPFGTTLLGHTLNPFNGLVAIPLLRWMSLGRSYDTIIVLSFVFSGLTQFWLAWHVTRQWGASLLAGFLFTFSAYHCAHADGHLQLVAMEWLPLFLLAWILLLEKKTAACAIFAALTLFLVILCDYYYFAYAILAAALISVDALLRDQIAWESTTLRPILLFIAVTLMSSGVLAGCLMYTQHTDPFLGAHDAGIFSMDLFAPFVPGSHWRFSSLTQCVWSHWTGDPHETSVYLGWSVIGVLLYVWKQRRVLKPANVRIWGWIAFCFGVLALGPYLHIGGRTYKFVILPYALLQSVFPFMKLSGCPVRMAMMLSLAASILVAIGVTDLWNRREIPRGLFALAAMLMLVEYWPQPLPVTSLAVPAYVTALAQAPSDGAVIDTVSSQTWMMYYATVHGKPMALGYLSRVPTSLWQKDEALKQIYRNGEWDNLYRFGFRYVVMTPDDAAKTHDPLLRRIYQGSDAVVERIGA